MCNLCNDTGNWIVQHYDAYVHFTREHCPCTGLPTPKALLQGSTLSIPIAPWNTPETISSYAQIYAIGHNVIARTQQNEDCVIVSIEASSNFSSFLLYARDLCSNLLTQLELNNSNV